MLEKPSLIEVDYGDITARLGEGKMSLVSRLPDKITRICLDLDDVLVDFEGAVEELWFGDKIRKKYDQFVFWRSIAQDKENRDKMWILINEVGVDFWANLKKLPWADDLWESANRVCDDVIILSSPGDSVAAEVAAQGKVRWCMKEFGHNVLCAFSWKCFRSLLLFVPFFPSILS